MEPKEVDRLAWLVLQIVNRTQAKGSTARLAVPRDPEVVDQLGIDITEEELLSVEEYLEDRGYLELADISLTRGTYTITPAGLTWLEGEPPGELEATEKVEDEAEPGRYTESPQPWPRVSWWSRRFGGRSGR
ncbi:MAG TPA: hypothetical protein VFI90_18180 [Rubrobacter sp.]|nr:hypothetical protein [Rubrobacter sp.]